MISTFSALPRLVAVEALKLRRSLVLLLCAAAPTLIAVLVFLMFLREDAARPFDRFTAAGAALWAYFMLPMTVTALTILIAQIEHAPRAWNHILALPVPRPGIYLAKAIVVVLLCAGMSAGLAVMLPLTGVLAEASKPGVQLTGATPWRYTAELIARMFGGSMLLVAIQLWAALRLRSFVPPLVLGIGGTFVAVAATGAEEGAYFPWLIPVQALANDPEHGANALRLGLFGGLVVLAFMVVAMGRTETR